jgi:hypothetical protein
MLKPPFTMKGWLLVHVVASPPSHTEAVFKSVRTLPDSALHAATGWLTRPLLFQEQLGLQQSQ